MKKNDAQNFQEKSPNVKEISDGVYINLNRITSDEIDFEKAVEESFKELDKEEENLRSPNNKPRFTNN